MTGRPEARSIVVVALVAKDDLAVPARHRAAMDPAVTAVRTKAASRRANRADRLTAR